MNSLETMSNLINQDQPFTPDEERIMNLIVAAHNEFVKLEASHPMEMQEWIANIHNLQRILMARSLRRLYPHVFK